MAATVKASAEAPEPFKLVGANDAVTPVGIPLAVSVTTPVNPFSAATVTIAFAEDPGVAPTEEGAAESVKSGAFTMNCMTTGYAKLPLEPETVTRYVPGIVAADVVRVNMALPAPVMDVWKREAVTPEGSPLTERLTISLKPLKSAILI